MLRRRTTDLRGRRLTPGRRSPEAARREILLAARAFLAKRPFRDLTVAALMKRTPIGRSAFYAYFRDVYQLAEALLHEVQQEILTAAAPWIDGSDDSLDAMRTTLRRTVDVWVRQGPMIRGISDAATQDARLERVWESLIAVFDQAVADLVRRDRKAGFTTALDPDEAAAALNRLNIAYLNHQLGRPEAADAERVLATLQTIWTALLYPHGASIGGRGPS